MQTHPVHPKAYLTTRRNVSTGLRTRTKIIESIERQAAQVNKIAKDTGLSHGSIRYHLRILRKERIVEPAGWGRPSTWRLTSFGQQQLV